MSTKEKILQKIQIVITNHFKSPEEAYAFFDKDSNDKLTKKEITKLLKQAKINGFIRGIVATKLIEGYDKNNDGQISWDEFKIAINEISES